MQREAGRKLSRLRPGAGIGPDYVPEKGPSRGAEPHRSRGGGGRRRRRRGGGGRGCRAGPRERWRKPRLLIPAIIEIRDRATCHGRGRGATPHSPPPPARTGPEPHAKRSEDAGPSLGVHERPAAIWHLRGRRGVAEGLASRNAANGRDRYSRRELFPRRVFRFAKRKRVIDSGISSREMSRVRVLSSCFT